MKTFAILPLALALATSPAGAADVHSYANPDAVRVRHVTLDLAVDFTRHVLAGHAILDVERLQPEARELVLDTRELGIGAVQVAGADGAWRAAEFVIGPHDPVLGSPLTVVLPESATRVRIDYETSPRATGLQWLEPAQTAGKKYPFLFSQAQAIHARSFIPLQDTPAVRITYEATLRTPPGLKAVMSAEMDPADRDGTYAFRMNQPIPSYLIALAVGDLAFKATGPRTGVYAEPAVLDAAAREFEDTEAMIQATEKLYGPYRWGRYDLLILPPSFPFGGMENPRLTFATPTVIAGDKSLVSLVAHELAHSWSGNLVTNASWRDLWLNEGFTVYVESRIMEAVFGARRARMEAVLGYQDLLGEFERHPDADEVLAIDLRGRDPDDVFSSIPYEKGRLFLVWLEHKVGRAAFDAWLRSYFEHFAFRSITTEQFLEHLERELLARHPGRVSMETVKQWVYAPGLPADAVLPQSEAFAAVDAVREAWLAGRTPATALAVADWSTQEWLHFIDGLPEKIAPERLAELDAAFDFSKRNAEIAHSWFLVAIRNGYTPAYPALERYLVEIGRRKLIKPLYEALMKTPEGAAFAKRVYAKARPGYHYVSTNTLDALVNPAAKQ
ncbi:MAG TPA: M1 family metallopeptidase [Gammaproteobacteria bacterium]|nr:M1 family metallopeptidase [Gammaproteobacteria bacterium]